MLDATLIRSCIIIISLFTVLILPAKAKAETAGNITNELPDTTLSLPAIEGSHGVGNDQNNLGINAYKKKKFNQALKHFKVASLVDRKKGEIFFNLGLT